MYVYNPNLLTYMHTYTHACMYMRLSCTFTLTSLSIYEWILFQKQELFNMRIQKSVFMKIIHTYKHIHQLLVRPPDYFNFVLRQAVPPTAGNTGINYYAQLYFLYFFKMCVCVHYFCYACTCAHT